MGRYLARWWGTSVGRNYFKGYRTARISLQGHRKQFKDGQLNSIEIIFILRFLLITTEETHQNSLQLTDRLMLDRLSIYLAYLIAHVQRSLTMDHSAVHDPCHNTATVLGHLQRDSHWLVRVLLELHQTDAGHVLQLSIVNGVDVVHAAVQVRRNRGRRHPQRLVAINLSCNHIVSMQKSLEAER